MSRAASPGDREGVAGLRAVIVVVLVVTGGCLSGVSAPGAAPTGTVADGGTDAGPGTAAAPGPTRNATVTAVVDGDTVEVTYPNGTADTVRLLGVDTPEVHTDTDPDEFGVPDTAAGRQCLRRAGENASAYATDRLAGRSVRLGFDPESERRGYYGRLLAYVYVDGESFNRALLRTGRARVYDSAFTQRERYERTAAAARTDRRGVWACADGVDVTATATAAGADAAVAGDALELAEINYDAAGNDNENPTDEYVRLRNAGADPLEVSGWTVADDAGHEYTFPDGTVIAPGSTVTLRTGAGTDADGTYYWGRSGAVWNNDGDTVTVRDAAGSVVLRESY